LEAAQVSISLAEHYGGACTIVKGTIKIPVRRGDEKRTCEFFSENVRS
jgi:hypothetical protein